MYLTRLSLTPAESWMLIGALAVLALLFTLLLKELLNAADVFPKLLKKNVKLCGLKGLWYTLWGVELEYVGLEKCIETVPEEGSWSYNVLTTDGDQNRKYKVIVSREDEENPDYLLAKELAFDDKKLLHNLLPDSRIKNHFYTTSKETGEVLSEIFVLYLKNNNTAEVEEVLNKYFEDEHKAIMKEVEVIA